MQFIKAITGAVLVLCLALNGRAADTSAAPPVPVPTIVLFSPEGTAKDVRQVVARFSTDMVRLGDPWLDDPFDVECPVSGKGRWVDTRNWAYDFDADPDAGVACRFSLRPGTKSVAGQAVSGRREFRFDTGGPAVVASLPREGWEVIDEHQIFLLRLNAPASAASIEAHAYCAIAGLGERIPLRVLSGAERATVLAQRKLLGYDYLQLLWKSGVTTSVRARNRAMEKRDQVISIVQCQRSLPPATQVLLHWGSGISTESNIRTTADQQLAFRVRPAFIAQLECTRTNPRAGCLPIMPIQVNFSAPVSRAQALAIRLTSGTRETYLPTTATPEPAPTVDGVSFDGPFPESASLSVRLPPGLADDAGRLLQNADRFPLEVRVDRYPPLVKFNGNFGILESKVGGVLPVTMRNVEPKLATRISAIDGKVLRLDADPAAIVSWLQRVEKSEQPRGEWRVPTPEEKSGLKPKLADSKADDLVDYNGRVWIETTGSQSLFSDGEVTRSFELAKPLASKDTEVVGIPLGRNGFYVVEVASPLLGSALMGEGKIRHVATAALVTDLAVHFKWGRESSLAWVTRLSSAQPVADADVVVADRCSGETLWRGRTDAEGVAYIDHTLGMPTTYGRCPWQHPLLVLAKTGDDFSFTASDWAQGIGPADFSLPTGGPMDGAIYHTVLDRALFRPGETVSMKHYLREHRRNSIELLPESSGSHDVEILHEGGEDRYQLKAQFDDSGVATNTWAIPKEARLGDYQVWIDRHLSGRFKVGEFRLPSMHASVNGPAQRQVAPSSVTLDLHVAYLSGGGASGLPVKVRTQVEPVPATFTGYEDYSFGGEAVTEGVSAQGGSVADIDGEDEDSAEAPAAARMRTIPLTLDANGAARVTVDKLPRVNSAARLTAELEYADGNGEILTSTGNVQLVPAAVSLGLRTEGWVAAPGQVRFRVVALDLDGHPKAQQAIRASLFQVSQYSYRKRLIGGFYSYETTREVRKLATSCSGLTNAQGLLLCELAPGVSGQVVVRAEGADEAGRPSGATTTVWVVGRDEWWFGGTSGDRMDVLPEKKEYRAGETARLQVRMPFRQATALVTVEREGVIDRFVRTLSGTMPVIEVPIRNTYAPNVYVSVLAVRARVAHSEGRDSRRSTDITALVDLTRPAYRLGEVALAVGWQPHRLAVAVTPVDKTYPVGAKVPVNIHVQPPSGQALPAGTEVAVAAVDEAVLDLAPNPSWDLLAAMMGQRGIEVWTSTGQMQIVGKRHYGRKAVPHGGGGGREGARARELFDSLLYWNPRVVLDAEGNATVTVPLNDSLTSFRLVAIAHGGTQLFGTGSANVATTQDLILQSGLPPLAREGDHFSATFTVRNTTDRVMTVHLQASSAALGARGGALDVSLSAHAARDVAWPAIVPVDRTSLPWEVIATETGGAARDRLRVSEQVIPAYPVRTYQATIAQVNGTYAVPAAIPAGAVPGRGGLVVTLQSTLAGSLDGVREYMSRYPYVCFEQQASVAVALRSRAQWDALMHRLPAYLDADGLLKYFASDWLAGDDTLTAYVLSLAEEASYPIPDAQRTRMVSALTQFVQGRLVRYSALETADLTVRKLQAIDALARYGAAQPAMLDSLALEPALLPTSALLDLVDVLARVNGIAGASGRRAVALAQLRTRLNFQGTIMGFSTERADALWWLMISADSNANRMLLTVLAEPGWREDIPRLVRGSLGRQQFGRWNTTVANAWGVLAMEKFSSAFEFTPVTGSTTLQYGITRQNLSWTPSKTSQNAELAWQKGTATLQVTHGGSGAPWAMVRAMAALPLDHPVSTGFKVTRIVTGIERQRSGAWTRGDVVRVHLDLEAQSEMSWVVIDDPIPAGASVLDSGIGGQSALLQQGAQRRGIAWLAFEERRFDAYRAYYRFVPKGHWSTEYTVRLNNPGTFVLPATRVEAMYAPDMLCELPNAPVTIEAGEPAR